MEGAAADAPPGVSPKKRARLERKQAKKAQVAAEAWTRCMHYFPSKSRHCSIPRRSPDSLYCGHHEPASAGARLPCPVDPSHEVWRRDLEQHVARCASALQERARARLPYYQPACNRGAAEGAGEAAALAGFRGALAAALAAAGGGGRRGGAAAAGASAAAAADAAAAQAPAAAAAAAAAGQEGGRGEAQGEEEGGEGAAEAQALAAAAKVRGGALSALARGSAPLADLPALCAKLLAWAASAGAAALAQPQERAVFYPETLPKLRAALAHTAGGEPGAAEQQQQQLNQQPPTPAEEEAALRALLASKHTKFRHEYQQASIVSNVLSALRVGGGGGSGGAGARGACFQGQLLQPLAPAPASGASASAAAAPPPPPPPPLPLFVEFGAGRGMLSYTLERALHCSGARGARLLLIDRSSVGRKADKEVRREASASASAAAAAGGGAGGSEGGAGEASLARVRLDIADCAFAALLDSFSPRGGGVVSLGKHLCGAATDLALRSIVGAFAPQPPPPVSGSAAPAEPAPQLQPQQPPQQPPPQPPPRHTFAGLGIALCCHHACNWEDYCGKEWWRSGEGLAGSALEFEAARYLSSWALLEEDREGAAGGGSSSSSSSSGGGGGGGGAATAHALPPPPPTGAQHAAWVQALPTAVRASVGRAAKRAIDAGRLHFLRGVFGGSGGGGGEGGSQQQRGSLLHYCSRRVSLENALLLFV